MLYDQGSIYREKTPFFGLSRQRGRMGKVKGKKKGTEIGAMCSLRMPSAKRVIFVQTHFSGCEEKVPDRGEKVVKKQRTRSKGFLGGFPLK